MNSMEIEIITLKEIAEIFGKSERWTYNHAAELGGVKIGGSWFFTKEGLDAVLREKAQKIQGSRQVQNGTVHSNLPDKARGRGMGNRKKKRAQRESRKEHAKRHSLDGFLPWVFGSCSAVFRKNIQGETAPLRKNS